MDGEVKDIIWISGESWDRDGGSHRAMATAMSEYCRTLWVDPPSSPVSRSRRNRSFNPVLTEVSSKIVRLTPVVFPGFSRWGIRCSTPLLLRAQIRWAVRKLSFRPSAVVMLYLGGLLGGWGSSVTNVLYGTDDYVAGAKLMHVSARHLGRRERQALSKANVVVTISSDLASRWAGMGVSPVVIPNGCWPLDGRMNRRVAVEVDLPSPVVGLIGRLSGRIDLGILEAIADSDQSLLLIGPHDPRWEPKRFQRLIDRPSVRYVGPIPNAEVPAYLAAIDVGITPYLDTAFNRGSFPLKTLEYLSVGLPVVASTLPTMRWLRADLEEVEAGDFPDQMLVLAEDSQGYVRAIRALTSSTADSVSRRIAFAHRHSWASRARHFAAVMGLL